MSKLDLVVPCYNEEKTIRLFYEKVKEVFNNFPKHERTKNIRELEIIFVNDGSIDDTIIEMLYIKAKSEEEPNISIKVIDLSRNFGKEGALLAGLENTSGEYVAIMDVDLQDPPEMLIEMFSEMGRWELDVVGCRRVSRKGEPPIRSMFARLFYKIINKITDVEIVDGARDYRLMHKYVVDSVVSLAERNRFSKGIFPWVGYKTKYLEYENIERVAGESSWSFFKLAKYAIDGIIAFTTAPLKISTFLGFLISIISFISLIFIVIRAFIYGDPVAGWPSMVSIMLMLGGIELLSLGIIGEYLGKTYIEAKQRPNYIIKKKYE